MKFLDFLGDIFTDFFNVEDDRPNYYPRKHFCPNCLSTRLCVQPGCEENYVRSCYPCLETLAAYPKDVIRVAADVARAKLKRFDFPPETITHSQATDIINEFEEYCQRNIE